MTGTATTTTAEALTALAGRLNGRPSDYWQVQFSEIVHRDPCIQAALSDLSARVEFLEGTVTFIGTRLRIDRSVVSFFTVDFVPAEEVVTFSRNGAYPDCFELDCLAQILVLLGKKFSQQDMLKLEEEARQQNREHAETEARRLEEVLEDLLFTISGERTANFLRSLADHVQDRKPQPFKTLSAERHAEIGAQPIPVGYID